jgi:parallel beta-helix repeat protein
VKENGIGVVAWIAVVVIVAAAVMGGYYLGARSQGGVGSGGGDKPPNKPTNLSTSMKETPREATTSVPLSCFAKDNDGDKINVFFYDNLDKSLIDNVWVNSGKTAQVSWNELTMGQTYVFFARAQDNNGKWGDISDTYSILVTSNMPISIEGDDNFTFANGVNGGGTGTAGDPYIIDGWTIEALGTHAHGISIQDTTAYFIVQNCFVPHTSSDYFGIFLNNVINGKIENNVCKYSEAGICLYRNDFNNILTGNTVSNNNAGIILWYSSNNIISNNICENNWGNGERGYDGTAINLQFSSNNIIDKNTCSNNNYYGISISSNEFNPSYNNLTNNICENNRVAGINLEGSHYNVITGNTCENNECGILLNYASGNNTIILNYLNNNENNAYDSSHDYYGPNHWDNNGKGNYWSDWQPPEHPDADGDGIVDEPRPIAGGGNHDSYPLVLVS